MASVAEWEEVWTAKRATAGAKRSSQPSAVCAARLGRWIVLSVGVDAVMHEEPPVERGAANEDVARCAGLCEHRASQAIGRVAARLRDVMVSPPNEFYGPHVAGPEGAMTVEVFSSIRGTGNVVYETSEGPKPASYR